MLKRLFLVTALVAMPIFLMPLVSGPVSAQSGDAVALSGRVSSTAEGEMEGVVVSARREGADHTVSVVSDASGVYRFPRTHLEPGVYAIASRAVGYDLVDPGPVTVASANATTADLELREAANVGLQLSSREWAMSFPVSDEQKGKVVHQLLSCAYCHTYQRIMRSRHTSERFMPVIDRMIHYYADGTAVSNDNRRGRAAKIQERGREAMEEDPIWGVVPGIPRTELAEFFSSVNLSGGRTTWDFELQRLPRPTGQATRVIITEYDMPTASTASHDSAIDSKGNLWYTDESAQLLGKFETKTGQFTEYAMPPVPEGELPGTRDVVVDHNDKVWFPVRIEGGEGRLAMFDPDTEELTLAEEGARGQFIALGPDGKIWAGFSRIDPETMTVDGRFSYQGSPNLPEGPHGGYHNVVDSRGNPYIATYRGSGGIIGVDTETGEVEWVPVPGLKARRGKIDDEDRYWFGEYLSDKIGMFNTRTKEVQRWDVPQYSTPYTASTPDKNGYVYAPSNMSERFMRLDPRTGELIEYQMPTEFDTKKISHDPTTDRVVLWMTNMRTARVTRIEPLD